MDRVNDDDAEVEGAVNLASWRADAEACLRQTGSPRTARLARRLLRLIGDIERSQDGR